MIYALRNDSSSSISLNNKLIIDASMWHVIYDSSTHTLSSGIEDIIGSCDIMSAESTNNINYCLHLGKIKFFIDGSLQDKSVFYSWLNTLKENYKYYSQFITQGFIETKLDNENGKIIFKNRELLVSDLPDHIDASKIANGSISNSEFETLEGIDTTKTIQEQLDEKFNKNDSRVFRFVQDVPATYWLVVHNLNCIPLCSVYDNGGEELLATIITLDSNTLAVRFSKAYAGSCSLSY